MLHIILFNRLKIIISVLFNQWGECQSVFILMVFIGEPKLAPLIKIKMYSTESCFKYLKLLNLIVLQQLFCQHYWLMLILNYPLLFIIELKAQYRAFSYMNCS